uniref:14-3-3 protein 7-like n=1 Tax=Erigeron canadensis TaxID=72917 RepID=UPI001CB948F8|nr:14-3-3 protein 7-like [Erigeron canadensis]
MDIQRERDRHVYLAKIAERARRFDDMVKEMNSVAMLNVELTVDERNLLFLGYKNVTGEKRASWRTMRVIEHNELVAGHEQKAKKIQDYVKKIEHELTTICNDLLSLIDHHLLPSSKNGVSAVFLHKMKGDCFRYLAEIKVVDDDRIEDALQALEAYETATTIATLHTSSALLPTHPLRLGLALNFSVFQYQIMNSRERAFRMAKRAYDDAVAELKFLGEASYEESTHILHLIRDNLTRWSAEVKEGDERTEFASQSLKAYEEATELAMSALSPSDPDKLCLSMNYSVLHYDILKDRERAYNIAELAYGDAVDELDLRGIPFYEAMTPAEQAKRDAVTRYLKQLKENLDFWSVIAEEEVYDCIRKQHNDIPGAEIQLCEAVLEQYN